MPEFETFKANQFRHRSDIIQSLNLSKQEEILELNKIREKTLVENKGSYGSYFQNRINDPFK